MTFSNLMKTLVLFLMTLPPALMAPRQLPYVPDVVFPPVPEDARLSAEQLRLLQETDQDPEVRPGLFQGDMALTNEMYDFWRVGIRWDVLPERMWQNNTVPYVISPLYETTDYVTIYNAILTLNFLTCIKFVPWDGKAKDFLLIWPMKYPEGCWSYVGRFGGPQIVSLLPPNEKGPNCLGGEGRSIHELLHALGIFHEQSRADRDQFVDVHVENIIPEFLVNFNKESLENTTYSFEYDYESIMHYGAYYFSKGKGLPTITPKKKGIKLGQRSAMSETDCLKINDLYGCLDKSLYHRRKYYTLCKFMGL
ncbi:hatching enzyme 1.2-like isoform X2 [Periplaneta americana]|uniref:hatching enzyme 1.2-like isoform X2 n=1 Tax=Periplaneta americana TaxID=6978 RepID=UPI0037E9A8A5